MLKKQISRCLFEITDPLDPKVVEMTKLPDYLSALNAIHSPQDTESIKKAEKRMIFNDMLYYTTKLKSVSYTHLDVYKRQIMWRNL